MNPNATTTTGPRGPAILLAEDDPASRRFLTDALQSLGCSVVARASGDAALETACAQRFDLLLIDRNLPQLDGVGVLQRLRQRPRAASHSAPAIAASAEWDDAQRAHVHRAGFAAVLAKPCSRSELRARIEQHIDPRTWPVSHDETALAAAGSEANLAALRRLFATELAQLARDLPTLYDDRPALLDRLHRLCASAGFCGAPALAAACRQWLAHLRLDDNSNEGRDAFERSLAQAGTRFHE